MRKAVVAVAVLSFLIAGGSQALWASTDFIVPPGPGDAPNAIAKGSDGNLWFTNFNGRTIGRITPTGVITKFAVPNAIDLDQIVLGPDGNLWFTDDGGDFIGSITTAGAIT
ncbi:MAG TPA: hypothetical protein VGR50_00445, partial [Terriglobales bacterium]|nr:hypothetical protein [Terriglobales bacterium]